MPNKKMIHHLSKRRRLQLIQKELKLFQLPTELLTQETSAIEHEVFVANQVENITNENHPCSNNTPTCLPSTSDRTLIVNTVVNTDNISVVHENVRITEIVGHGVEINNIASSSNVLPTNEINNIAGSSNVLPTNEINLIHDLSKWISNNHIRHSAVNELLIVLKRHGHNELPLDVRTLLGTPKNTRSRQIKFKNGNYIHVGFEIGVTDSLKTYFEICPDKVKININIDGLPLTASSGSQFWPVMGSVVAEFFTEPFVIGIFHGSKKPEDVNNFLLPFVEEAKIITKNGVCVGNNKVGVEINAIICDAPAKAFISCVKGHSGYFGCSKCIQEGDFVENRVTFPSVSSALRTDDAFKKRQQEEHHVGSSCLEELGIGMVSQLPLDYMHLVCLGIMKRLLLFWVRGKGNIKLKPAVLDACSNYYTSTRCFIPDEFARKPRSLYDVDRWKATEFRLILLYLGMVVLKDFLSSDRYYHLLSLSVAIRILADTDLCHKLNEYANSLLIWFVQCYGELYGSEFYSYNVHNLVHLANDVKRFGALDKFSAFKYENHMQKIKAKIVPNGNELQQIVNRLQEVKQLPLQTSFQKAFPHPKRFKKSLAENKIHTLQFNGFSISVKQYNNCCELQDGTIAVISNIFQENGTFYLSAKYFCLTRPFFDLPCNSNDLGIAVVSQIASNTTTISSSLIKRKCMMVKLPQEEEYLIIPLLH